MTPEQIVQAIMRDIDTKHCRFVSRAVHREVLEQLRDELDIAIEATREDMTDGE